MNRILSACASLTCTLADRVVDNSGHCHRRDPDRDVCAGHSRSAFRGQRAAGGLSEKDYRGAGLVSLRGRASSHLASHIVIQPSHSYVLYLVSILRAHLVDGEGDE